MSTEVLTFRYDGKESLNPGAAEIPVKLKAHWDGPKFIAETERDINGFTVTTTQISNWRRTAKRSRSKKR